MATLSLRLDALGIAVGRHALHARTLLVSMAKHALTRAHAHARTQAHTHTHAHTHTRTHANTHAHTHSHTHTNTHAHSHRHTDTHSWIQGLPIARTAPRAP
jgi:ABC-type Zn2+ transport system substrate-binding protein/surface adhesin